MLSPLCFVISAANGFGLDALLIPYNDNTFINSERLTGHIKVFLCQRDTSSIRDELCELIAGGNCKH
jgi:hypothetical protein